jgi:hypothetical protein
LKGFSSETHQDLDAYYVELSRVLRSFVAERFQLRALHRTLEEISLSFPELEPPYEEKRDELLSLLDRCDLAKFSGSSLMPEEAKEVLALAIEWVEPFARDLKDRRRPLAPVPEGGRHV